MLKIKDSVDLTELEKFGYSKDCGMYDKNRDWQTVHISEETRIIWYTSDDDYDYVEYGYYDDLVDDLIQAGLVEHIKK